uniref:G_PROTEIN_RECEP_F1_2 domain-containing protein n=2 Tax=Caenorhabditis japonica TaxID=281687 RepID=A0A8R1HJ38_CAEJA
MDFYTYLPLWHIFLSYFRIVMTESNCALFASMLMIVLATTERFLKTFDGNAISFCRKFLERNRYLVSAFCIVLACGYKYVTYYELDVVHNEQCSGFDEYEIVAGEYARNPTYRFYFMFLLRNTLDRILPFVILLTMNILIVRAVKGEERRKLQKESVVSNGKAVSSKTHRRNVKDATRALISLVSIYLLSQSLQVFLTVWETINRSSLEDGFPIIYSYLNDIVSIFTLLASCLRFPIYFCCNRLIHTASIDTLHGMHLACCLENSKKPQEYSPIHGLPNSLECGGPLGSPDSCSKPSAIYDEKLQEWRL